MSTRDKWLWGICEKCGEYVCLTRHARLTTWEVVSLEDYEYTQEDPEHWKKVCAADKGAAAEKFVELGDRRHAEFSEFMMVVVRAQGSEELHHFQIDGRLDPTYEGTPIDSMEAAKAKYREWYTHEPF